MPDDQGLGARWVATQARLPEGWSLDGLRCASTGLMPAGRSDDWVAVAIGPDGEERSARARTPDEAVAGGELAFGLGEVVTLVHRDRLSADRLLPWRGDHVAPS